MAASSAVATAKSGARTAPDRTPTSAPGSSKPGDPGLDTIPKLLLHHAAVRPERPAMREKDYGIWQSATWRDALAEVRALACGFAAMGLKRGDRVAVIGDNRPRLYWSMTAAQCLGAIPVPMYQDSNASELEFVLQHAEVRFAVAEDQEQVDKLLEAKERCTILEAIIFDDPRGLRNYPQPFLRKLADLQEEGRKFDAAHPDFFAAEIARGKGGDIASFYYTSGTTGQPKGVILSFDNVILTAQAATALEGLTDRESSLAYLPMAWVGDSVSSVGQAYCAGFCVSCPESGATVMQDLREIGPTYFFAPPRIWENILTTVMIRMEDAGAIKRWLFKYFMALARRVGTRILDGETVSPLDRLLYWLGNLLVYGPLKNTLGMSRIRLAYTAGEAIGPDIFVFYRSLGINIKQFYGSTEAAVFITIQPNREISADTVGKPVTGVELKIAENGEVMFRSPGVFREYYKNPEATAQAKTPDGWVHTGDAGYIDARGHLKIIDRAKDVGRLRDNTLFAPKYLENKLKFFSYIKEAVAFGDGRDFAAAFINIDLGAVGNWAERRGLAYTSYSELADKPEVYELIRGNIEEANRDLANDPVLAGSQIKRFLILRKELDADDGELTRTRKVRRGFIADKYGTLVDALYSDRSECEVETQVKFEDGRSGTIRAVIRIAEARTFPAARPPAAEVPLKKAS